MAAARVLITGVSSPLGARLAEQLAGDPRVERVTGIDVRTPPQQLAGRIGFVEADLPRGGLGSVLREAAPDVVVHHDIMQFPGRGRRSPRALHDLNVIGTLQLTAACSEVPGLRALVVRSSAAIYGASAELPAFCTEDLAGQVVGEGSTRFQRDVAELERLVGAFARRRPEVTCTVLRLQPVIGTAMDTPLMQLFRAPVVPTFLGFDARIQVLHQDDAVAAVAAAVHHPVRGPVNVAGEGAVSLSRALRRAGRRALPIAAPLYGPATAALHRVGVPPMTDDVVRYLRHGRAVDTTRMRRDLGFTPRHTTLEAIDAVAAELRGTRRAAA